MENHPGRTVAYSRTTITELMIPSYANFGGKIHGGILLSLIDKVAYACASKHAGNYCVTVSVDGVVFLQPVEVGDLVSLHASINYVGRTSLVVGIKVIAENVKQGSVKHTNTSYVTMVAKDDDNKPALVPPLVLDKPVEVRRFYEAMKRKELNQSFNEKMDETKANIDMDDAVGLLKEQRCTIILD
ncbi:MAG: acyl-CoA thioesterase [Fulvivirga sp.]|uniref:acyl-CoA thioesterase n=1 Tax=Fulvivirga sp. TaxID=1931237 RepID=UPI0032EF5CE3